MAYGLLLGALVLMTLVALAGCGAGRRASAAPVSPSASATSGVVGRMVVIGCPGGNGDAGAQGRPALTLTPPQQGVQGAVATLHLGQIVQVDLPQVERWNADPLSGATLTLAEPAGIFDTQASACVWRYRATAVGDTTLGFTGTALCEPQQPCPQYAKRLTFSLRVVA